MLITGAVLNKEKKRNYEVATISSIPQAQKYEEEMKIQMGGSLQTRH
ncbi:unnamed protein product [Musa textilis]